MTSKSDYIEYQSKLWDIFDSMNLHPYDLDTEIDHILRSMNIHHDENSDKQDVYEDILINQINEHNSFNDQFDIFYREKMRYTKEDRDNLTRFIHLWSNLLKISVECSDSSKESIKQIMYDILMCCCFLRYMYESERLNLEN